MAKTRKPSAIVEDAENMMAVGVKSPEDLAAALPLYTELVAAQRSLGAFAKKLGETAEALSELCSAYATRAPKTAFARGKALVEEKAGQRGGVVDAGAYVEGAGKYRFAESRTKRVRVSGDNFTQEFLAGLPDGWTAPKLEIDKSALKDKSDEELFAEDIARQDVRKWTEVKS